MIEQYYNITLLPAVDYGGSGRVKKIFTRAAAGTLFLNQLCSNNLILLKMNVCLYTMYMLYFVIVTRL